MTSAPKRLRTDHSAHAPTASELRHSILEALPDAITVLRRDGTIVDFKGDERVPTPPRSFFVGKNLRDVHHVQSARILAALELAFRTHEIQRVEYEAVVDGVVRYRAARMHRLNDEEALWIVRDVTDDRASAQRLAFTERMASLGTLAAGVGHELNNPLQYVLANIEMLEDHLQPLSSGTAAATEAHAMLEEAREGIVRVAGIVASLKAFSRADEAETAMSFDASKAVATALKLAARELNAHASLDVDISATAAVVGSEARLAQVFLNLLLNASQALDGLPSQRNRITVRTRRIATDRLAVEVGDNGRGIPSDVRSRIFDPFFTTKPVGMGTGLGLSIALQIVRAAGGDIEVETEQGKGSLFRVLLSIANVA